GPQRPADGGGGEQLAVPGRLLGPPRVVEREPALPGGEEQLLEGPLLRFRTRERDREAEDEEVLHDDLLDVEEPRGSGREDLREGSRDPRRIAPREGEEQRLHGRGLY